MHPFREDQSKITRIRVHRRNSEQKDLSVPLMHHDMSDLGSWILVRIILWILWTLSGEVKKIWIGEAWWVISASTWCTYSIPWHASPSKHPPPLPHPSGFCQIAPTICQYPFKYTCTERGTVRVKCLSRAKAHPQLGFTPTSLNQDSDKLSITSTPLSLYCE